MLHGKMNVDWQQRLDFAKLRTDRVDRANKMLHKYGIGSALLYDWDSQRYVASTFNHPYSRHHPVHFSLFVRDAGFPYIHASRGLDESRVREDYPWLEGRITTDEELLQPGVLRLRPQADNDKKWKRSAEQIKAILKQHGVADLPLSNDFASPHFTNALQAAGIKVVDGNAWMQEARMVKTEAEIELMEMGASCNEAGYAALVRELRPGMTENDARGIMSKAILSAGAEYIEGWVTNSGPRAAPRSYNWSDRTIRPSELFGIEACHVTYCGYKVCYDRTFSIAAKPTELQNAIYQVAVDMQHRAAGFLRPGLTTHEVVKLRPTPKPVFRTMEDIHKFRAGWSGWSNHFGGMGMAHDEAPYCTLEEPPITLEKNMIIAYHTTLWGEKDGVAIENTYRLTDNGCENLCKWPYEELMVIGL
ncbi:MAG: aminopeptidase P family protein [Chloroflexi bacterium]|nr:aminopeptidase P family protein [Chloroflexota bacterium]